MHIRLNLFVDTDKSHLAIENEIIDILSKTSDYQHGDITVDSGSIIRAHHDEYINTSFYITDCTDMGHTRNALNELFQYLRKEFV